MEFDNQVLTSYTVVPPLIPGIINFFLSHSLPPPRPLLPYYFLFIYPPFISFIGFNRNASRPLFVATPNMDQIALNNLVASALAKSGMHHSSPHL